MGRMQECKIDNSTRCSQAVSHPGTDQALCCLTSVIGRELVFLTWYGRCQRNRSNWGEKRFNLGRMQERKNDNSTQCSQVVSHPSTDRALYCLTSVIGRELVFSTWYGRCRRNRSNWGDKRFNLWRMRECKSDSSTQCSQAVYHPSTDQAL